MKESLNLDSGYRSDGLYKDFKDKTESYTGFNSFSLLDAEERTEELVEQLSSLGLQVAIPDHRVKPADEKDNPAEYERRVGENGTITFYAVDEESLGSIMHGGRVSTDHEMGHHLGYELCSMIYDSEGDGSEIDEDSVMERVRAKSYLQSENFADRFRVAVSDEPNAINIDRRSGSPEEYPGAWGEKYAIGRENWERSLPQLVDNLEDEVDEIVENLSAEGWDIERPVL